MSRSAREEVDPAAELGVVCLVNAGRWKDVEPFLAQYSCSAWSPEMAMGVGVARIRLERWADALDGLLEAAEKFPEHLPTRTLASRALVARAADLIQAREWREAAAMLNTALKLDPGYTPALRMFSALRGAGPMARLLAGERAETAAAWEQEFVRDRKSETAHHLAILYYWWAVHESATDVVRAASLWQKSIGYWVNVLNDTEYWAVWRASKTHAYELAAEAITGLESAVRKDLVARIAALTGGPGLESLRYVEDLEMDCWAEFEVAALLRATGIQPAFGPRLMDLLGCPEQTPEHGVLGAGRVMRLGDCDMPFVPDVDGLFTLYRAGLVRALAYFANGRYDRAETLVRKKLRTDAERGRQIAIVGEMLAFVRMRQAEDEYVRLKCPPESSHFDGIREYADAVRVLIDGLAEVRIYIVTEATQQALARLVELLCRRTYNEFTSFEPVSTHRVLVLEAGVELLDASLKLADGVLDIEEARLHLAALVNRLALQVGKDAHDRVIELLEWAVGLAPGNPNYQRNLAFSYFNRYASRKGRDFDIAGARDDIQKAFRLAPYDADIRAEYQQMHGLGRG